MPFTEANEPDFRCVWIEGPPNTGKSTSIRTCETPVGILSVPGEKGHASLPYGEGFVVRRWVDDATPMKDRNTLYYMKQWREVETATLDLINNHKLNTIVIDGIHKLYAIGLAIATDGESAKLHSALKMNDKGKLEGEFDPRCYGKAHNLMWEYVNLVASCPVKWRVFTSWAEMEKDDPDDTSIKGPKHLLPDLPGKAARRVVGEVSVLLHALVDPKSEYVWQTKPGGKVYGAGIKGPIDIVSKVPTFIPQDMKLLEQYLTKGAA